MTTFLNWFAGADLLFQIFLFLLWVIVGDNVTPQGRELFRWNALIHIWLLFLIPLLFIVSLCR